METPIEIPGRDPNPWLREKIIENVSQLEDRFGRITACRAVVKAPKQPLPAGFV